MRARCKYQVSSNWKNYGGRGITVCDRWQDFAVFLADMGERPSAKHSIERRDVNGNYGPANCIWATDGEQRANRRDTVWVEWQGERRKLLDVTREKGVKHKLVASRLRIGWPLAEALTRRLAASKSKVGRPYSDRTQRLMQQLASGIPVSSIRHLGAQNTEIIRAKRYLETSHARE
jgi:hypothetical protein